MGKTAFALNIAEHVARGGTSCRWRIFSLEMSGPQLAMRFLSSVGRLDQQKLRTGKLGDEEWDKMTVALGKLHEAPIHIDETGAINPSDLRARARRLHRQFGKLGLIVIDYLQLMTGNSECGKPRHRISDIIAFDHDQAEPAELAMQAARAGAQVDGLMAPVSSMWIGASCSLPSATVILSQSSSPSRPVRSFCWSSRPTEERIRIASCGAAHFHAENRHRQFAHADMLGDIQRERGLAHRGPPGHDDHVARLQARGLLVEIGEAGRQPGDIGRIVAVIELLDAVHHLAQHRLIRDEALRDARAGFGDLEYPRLGLVEQLLDIRCPPG